MIFLLLLLLLIISWVKLVLTKCAWTIFLPVIIMMIMVVSWVQLVEPRLQRTLISPSLSDHHLPITLHLGWRSYESLPSCAAILAGLNLRSTCLHCLWGESVCLSVTSESSISQLSSPSSSSTVLPVHSFTVTPEPWVEKAWYVAEHSQSLTLGTLISYESLLTPDKQLQTDASLTKVESGPNPASKCVLS